MDGIAGGLTVQAPGQVTPVQADSDGTLLRLWLHGRSASTRDAYRGEMLAFLAHGGTAVREARLADLQTWMDSLTHLKPASQARKMAAIRSLFTFAHRLGYVPFNVGAAVRQPSVRNTLSERILTEGDVHRMLALEPDPRNAALLVLLYSAGLRVTEAGGLRWRDLVARDDAGQVRVFGKGGKTRAVLLPASVRRSLVALQGEAGPDAPVFPSGKGGGHLTRMQLHPS